jgi:triacylglycerol lipase
MGALTAFRDDAYRNAVLQPLSHRPGFALDGAGTLAWAAQAASEVGEAVKFQAIMDDWQWTLLRSFDVFLHGSWPGGEAKGFVASAYGGTVISFAGTETDNLKEWVGNFNALIGPGGLHWGFKSDADAAWTEVVTALNAAPGPLYLTGHSLGGAIATITALRIAQEMPALADRIHGIYTFGMPRTGDATYAMRYNAALGPRTFRLVHGDDVVAKVPPAVLGFRHVGSLLTCDRDGFFGDAPQPSPDESRLAEDGPGLTAKLFSWFARRRKLNYPAANPAVAKAVQLLPNPVRDHLPDCYLRALRVLN